MSPAWSRHLTEKPVVVHLGAHKTASSYIQSVLKAERAQLAEDGVALLLPSDLRQKRTAREQQAAGRSRRGMTFAALSARIGAALDDPATRRVAMSEEGLIGAPRNNLATGSLYPVIMRRMGRLPAALDHPGVTILFAVRDYGPFFSSNVTTAVRRGVIFEPGPLRAALATLRRSWVDVIGDLRRAFPSARLRVWRYESFGALEPQVMTELVGRPLPPGETRNFKTLSQGAMQQIAGRLLGPDPAGDPRQIVRAAMRDHPISSADPPFSLWPEKETADLTRRYNADWDEIRARYPEIVLDGGAA